MEQETAASRESSSDTTDPQCHAEGTPQRTIRALDLWAMGVGAVVSGDFFGWQSVLSAGFVPGLFALCFATALYFILATSVAEVAAIEGMGGGPAHFVEACFGRHLAFFVGLAESVKCVIVLGVVATGLASYVGEILHFSPAFAPLCWMAFLGCFTVLNIAGGNASRLVQLVVTCISVLILAVFCFGALVRGVDVQRDALGGRPFWAATSVLHAFEVCPFSLWFYLGIEELPLAVDVTINPRRNLPRGLNASFLSLASLAFATLVISSSIPVGTEGVAKSSYPLLLGYRYVVGDAVHVDDWLWLFLTLGLAASLHSFVFATGQLLAEMAQKGYFPPCLALRTKTSGTPWVALVASSAGAYAVILLLYLFTGRGDISTVAISMCLLSTLLSYCAQLSCFLWLRRHRPRASRPFRSPCGALGAWAALALCSTALAAVLYLPVTGGSSYFFGLFFATVILVSCTIARELVWCCQRPALRGFESGTEQMEEDSGSSARSSVSGNSCRSSAGLHQPVVVG